MKIPVNFAEAAVTLKKIPGLKGSLVAIKLAQSSLFRLGGRIYGEFSGIPSICSDATTRTYLTGRQTFSLGCDGSRKFSGISDDEMAMGIPAKMLPVLTAALKIITAAPGSK
jgi:uncharacterized protein (DUF169 family)